MSLSKGEGLLGEQLTAFINKTTKKHGGAGGQLCEPKENSLEKDICEWPRVSNATRLASELLCL